MGDYDVELSATDTNTVGILKMIFEEAATCLPVWAEFFVVPANVYDAMTGADLLDVSVTQLDGAAQSLTDLKDFADAGYDPATNKVQGVVLTDTATTLTGHTAQSGDSYAIVNGAHGLVSIQDDVDLILADTNELQTNQGDWATATGFATPTNITAGTITTATNLTNMPSIPANWLTAAGIAASALDGKGDWNVGKTGYTLTQSFPTNFAALGISVGGAIDDVTLTATCTTNTDMRGTDSANTTVPDAAGVAATEAEVVAAIAAYDGPTNTEMTSAFTEIKGATWASGTDTLEAIRDRGDAAWTTGAGGSSPQVLQNTTIATLASQTSFTLTAGSADDDAYNNQMIIIEDQSTGTQKAIGLISDYTGSTKTVTLSVDPAVFTMATGDTVDIIAVTGSAIGLEVDANGRVEISGTLNAFDDLNNLSAAQVNAEALDVLSTDTFAEPTGVPGATVSLEEKIGFIYMALRNRVDVTATKKTFYDDADNAEWEKDLSDNGTTYSESEANTI